MYSVNSQIVPKRAHATVWSQKERVVHAGGSRDNAHRPKRAGARRSLPARARSTALQKNEKNRLRVRAYGVNPRISPISG